MPESKDGLIAVHVGAGHHSDSLKKKYQRLCRLACKSAVESLKSGKSSLDAVVDATIVLEDSPLTNAGYGSNLTITGEVECDASIMDGSHLSFGAIGAVSGVKNPIFLAKCLCEHQSVKISHGRVPPSVLVGPGAHSWAAEMGIATIPGDELVSSKAKKIYNHYKRKLNDSIEIKVSRQRMDTVGAICVDKNGNIASACSSGGIILKYPGRVGQAGVWSCGVWAKNGDVSVGSSTSGCGEHLIKTTLAKTIAEALQCKNNGDSHDYYVKKLHKTVDDDFINSEFLQGLEQKMGGGIVLRYDAAEKMGDLLWTHTTNSMILGYMNSGESNACSFVSSLDPRDAGKKAVVEGVSFKF